MSSADKNSGSVRVSLVESLFSAIIRLDGDSLVLHTGEKPYVVTSSSSMSAFRGPLAWGQVELSTRTLTTETVESMLDQMLTPEQRRVLNELGAVEHELAATEDRPAFTVVAARGGDDIWVEIRPLRAKREEEPQEDYALPSGHAVPEPQAIAAPDGHPSLEIVADVAQQEPGAADVTQLLESSGLIEPGTPEAIEDQRPNAAVVAAEEAAAARAAELSRLEAAHAEELARREAAHAEELARLEVAHAEELDSLEAARRDEEARLEAARAQESAREPERDAEPRTAVVVPLVRTVHEPPPAPPPVSTAPDLDRLLSIAAARGASGLYLVSRSVPAIRVEGETQQLEGEDALAPSDVEAFVLALSPGSNADLLDGRETSEWFYDVPELGRVRCLGFRDHRGPGLLVRMLPARAISAEQLGISKDIQAVCTQHEGLVLVTGPRGSGKSTLIATFVDLINRTRADHVISIERQITFVHESRRSFISQREVRGESQDVVSAIRAAMREDPDVLVIDELRAPEVVAVVLEAAESGLLVLAGIRAPGAGPALERLIEQLPAERRNQALVSLSASLRAVVAQTLLRKRGGGRVAARELLLSTAAAASVIADGKLFQLPAVLESGRKLGCVPLNDSLAALVRDGVVDAGEAWRKAYDREGLLALLRREGVDVERLA